MDYVVLLYTSIVQQNIQYSNCFNDSSFTVVKIVHINWFNDCNMNAFNYVFTDVDMQTWSSQLAQIQTKHQKEEERRYK